MRGGPDYVRPTAETPATTRRSEGWKQAEPRDHLIRGAWWEIFNDPELNALEEQVNISNQNWLLRKRNFARRCALVQVARAGYFPTVTAGASATRSLRSSERTASE